MDRPGDETLKLIDWLLENWNVAHPHLDLVEQLSIQEMDAGKDPGSLRCDLDDISVGEDLEYVRSLLIVAQHHLPSAKPKG